MKTASPKQNLDRDQMIIDHLPLVNVIAARIRENLPAHVDLDDLIQAGSLGLFDAAQKFDSTKDVEFHSYAKYRIRGAILDSLRQLDWASRDARRRQKQVESATQELNEQLARTPTEEEVAWKLGMSLDRVRQIRSEIQTVTSISGSTSSPEQDLPLEVHPPNRPETDPDSICAREQLRSLLNASVKTLPPRYQAVVKMYYGKEMTMKEIGGVLGINESRVSQIHKSALSKMAGQLHANGLDSSAAFV